MTLTNGFPVAAADTGPIYNGSPPRLFVSMSRLVLAPMEGLCDEILREVLTDVGGYDWCVTEFVRVSNNVLPRRSFTRVAPELLHGARTRAGTPVRVQLMGSDPELLAASAARLVALDPAGVDLNFGCPAPTVNRHRGGAALLDEPEVLHAIATALRPVVPRSMPFTAKMRLGIRCSTRAEECAQALEAGGVDEIVVHGRTKVDGYRPPARYDGIARVREAVKIPVIANGEIWTLEDYRRCLDETGCRDVMLGRGAIADPWLARRIRGEATPGWETLAPHIEKFWHMVCRKVISKHAPGRLKQFLALLRRAYPEADRLAQRIRPLNEAAEVEAALLEAGIVLPLRAAA